MTSEINPAAPTDDELRDLFYYQFTISTGHGQGEGVMGFARAVLARWGNLPARPDSSPSPPLAPTDCELEVLFRTWWQQSYPTPPGTHALMTHIGWARFLLQQLQEQERRQ